MRALHPDHHRVVEALTTPDLASIVDLVVWVTTDEGGELAAYAANHLGTVRWGVSGRRELVSGIDPIGSEDPLAFLPYAAELANPSPRVSTDNAYPDAAARLRSFFGHPDRSPDLAIVHTPRHYFPDEGGHRGEHGSLDVIQSRAPLILSGRRVRRLGHLDTHARLVDVGPTLAHLAGVPASDLRDRHGEPLDGQVRSDVLDDGEPGPVVGILWDGAHCGDLLDLAASGELPGVARLIETGVAYQGGALAQFPSVTLTNHTSILTGVGPGRHGVLGNVYYDRATQERVVPNDESTWHRSGEWLDPAVRTVFEMVADHLPPGSTPRTASVDEAIDRGADYSTMQLIRASGSTTGAGGLGDQLPDSHASPFLADPDHLDDGYFSWGVQVDDLGWQQIRRLWADPAHAPRLTWWANVVTDAGHHAGGPRSEIARAALRQSDARLCAFLDLLDRAGATDQVSFLLTADHGFEAADPPVTGSWGPALANLGVPYRDEGPGFVYLF
ncbi:MAG: alkaline phosphatase family protein [Tetrasphaera sp.]